MKTKPEIEDRINGCVLELDGHLHPARGKSAYNAALLQGWIVALNWVLENGNNYDRSEEIRGLIEE
jgi:hypothetical protein